MKEIGILRQRLEGLPGTLDAGTLATVLREVGRGGAIGGTAEERQALVDQLGPRCDAGAAALIRSFLGIGAGGRAAALSSAPGFEALAAGRAVLKAGDRGPAVRSLQEALIRLNFGAWSPTETFGPKTEAALRDFQRWYNEQVLAGTPTVPLAVDGKLGRLTLAALDAQLAALGDRPALGGQIDQADVVIDLRRQRAYVNAALVDSGKLAGLIEDLRREGRAVSSTYEQLIATLAPDGRVSDDYDARPVLSEHQLGLADSDGATRLFVSFPVAVGEPKGDGSYLTPTGSFVIGSRMINREANQWGVPEGFNVNPKNPFGPRFLRLHQVLGNGRSSYTAYGLHGTTATATWMKLPDGQRAVSHGCVRWANDLIVKLARYLPDGAAVRILGGLEADGRDLPPAPAPASPPRA